MDYYSVSEVSKLLNIADTTVRSWIKQGRFPGAFLHKPIKARKKSWCIPKKVVEELVFDFKNYYTVYQVMGILGRTKPTVLRWIHNGKITKCVLINNTWWLPKEQIDQLKSYDDYLTVPQLIDLFKCHNKTVLRLIKANAFPDAVFYHNAWRVPKHNVISYQKSIKLPGYLTTEETAQVLSLNISTISAKASSGDFEGAYKLYGKWFYPEQAVQNYLEQKQMSILTDPIEIFENGLTDIEKPKHLEKTIMLYKEFIITRLSASRATLLNKQTDSRQYLSTLNRFIPFLYKEIFQLNDQEISLILRNEKLNPSSKVHLTLFLDYCQGVLKCTFKKKYREVRQKNVKNDIYSPEEFFSYYTYTRDHERHLKESVSNRTYAVTWLYVLVHLIDAWRKSDILKLPNIPIEVIGIESFKEFNPSYFTKESSQFLVNQVASKIERMYVSKTGALGHFLVNQDMVIPTALALTLCELHRRNEKDNKLLRFWSINAKRESPHSDYHFKPFFKGEPELIKFSSLKMNRSLLTYFFYSVTDGEDDAAVSYDLSQRMRSHIGQDTTTQYIQSVNRDGPLDQVSINLFNRGHFGWLYNYILNLSMSDRSSQRLSMEQRTLIIKQLRNEYTPLQLEGLAYFLKKQQNEKLSLALRIAEMPLEKLQDKVTKIYRGQMPAKMKNAQCFTYPKCSFPTASSCLNCNYVIPKNYLMISITEEINSRIEKIQQTNYDAIRARETVMIYKMLDLLMQAKLELGKDYVSKFIDLQNLETRLTDIQHLFIESGDQ